MKTACPASITKVFIIVFFNDLLSPKTPICTILIYIAYFQRPRRPVFKTTKKVYNSKYETLYRSDKQNMGKSETREIEKVFTVQIL